MANTPDTLFVTGLDFAQTPASQIYVTPAGGSQQTLAAALANSGGGSGKSLVSNAVIGNQQLDGLSLPAGTYFLRLLLRETAGFATNVSLGTTLGASDIMPPFTLTATNRVNIDVLTTFLIPVIGSPGNIYITLSTSGTASVNAQLDYEAGP